MLFSPEALAQTEESTAIQVQQYEAEPGGDDIMGVQSSAIQNHMEWQLGAQLNIADDPLEVRTLDDDMTVSRIVDSQVGLDILGAIGFKDRFEFGLVLPITPYRNNGDEMGVGVPQDLSSAAVGDIRLVPKLIVSGRNSRARVTISMPISLPTGKDGQFYGEGSIGIEPRMLAGYVLSNGLHLAANLGIRFRSGERQFLNLEVGNELTYGLGARYPFKLAAKNAAAVSTLIGSVGVADRDNEERPLELMLGMEYWPSDKIVLKVGGGPGLSSGYGTPDFRLLAGIGFRHKPAEKATCMYGPEDMDGFEDDDACADLDNDQDGIADTEDVCPNEPETVNNIDDEDGCPEAPEDQVSEAAPPLEPAKDKDGDGIVDDEDVCPDEPEDMDQFTDLDGCPDPDNDRDGIADVDDKCPLEAEIINGTDDEDGCPDEGVSKVKVTDKKIEILDKVYFDTNKATIQERSFDILNQVSSIVRSNPQITKIRIEGHTDDRGNDKYNMKLSQDRATSVRQYLMDKGIDGNRLEAQGFGETKPIEPNKTKAGRAANRRVEFVITEIDGKPLAEDAATDTVESEQ